MNVDFLIIGQGLCGTFLHWYLSKQGYKCLVIDDNRVDAASRMAAGIVNPVTGRRIVKTWMIEQLLPFAMHAYKELEEELGCELIQSTKIIDFFPTPQMREAFHQRFKQSDTYLELPENENVFNNFFNNDFGFGEITPVYLISIDKLLRSYRKKLKSSGTIREEWFDFSDLHRTNNTWSYQQITCRFVMLCDGIHSVRNPHFSMLPFAPNKGEVLYVRIEDELPDFIFKKGVNLVKLGENNYWVGSSYEWNFIDDKPTSLFLEKTKSFLGNWLKVPFQILDHKAAIRPATLERRPFAGFHPLYPTLGILNGMGTKGCTLTPWFANELANHIHFKTQLNSEADILRFKNILSKF